MSSLGTFLHLMFIGHPKIMPNQPSGQFQKWSIFGPKLGCEKKISYSELTEGSKNWFNCSAGPFWSILVPQVHLRSISKIDYSSIKFVLAGPSLKRRCRSRQSSAKSNRLFSITLRCLKNQKSPQSMNKNPGKHKNSSQ